MTILQNNNQYEKDYSLKISKYMYDRFEELEIPVSITRDTDITLSPTERTNKILSFFGNDPNVIVVSNHLNAGGRVSKIVMDEIYWCITS